MLSINSNPLAYSVSRQLNQISLDLKDTSERIATGKRILSAKDDPAGVGILAGMKAQYASWGAVEKNLSSGQSLLEVSSTALKNQASLLSQMKDIATQASSDLITADQRTALQATFAELQKQVDSVVDRATIFGQNLVGAAAADVDIHTGINAGDSQTVVSIQSDGATLGVDSGSIDLTNSTNAKAAMTAIDAAINTSAGNQSIIGAQQNGFDVLVQGAKSQKSGLEGAMSRIEDADIAEESTKLQLLQARQQLGIQMLGIINQMPSYALSLLR